MRERGQLFDYEAADESDFRFASIMQLPTMHLDVVIVVPVVHANLNYQLPTMHPDVVIVVPFVHANLNYQLPIMHLDVVIVVPVVHANLNYQLPTMHPDVVFLSPQNIPSWVLYVNYKV